MPSRAIRNRGDSTADESAGPAIDAARKARADVVAALALRGVWLGLASEDVADSHRRTLLGPLWPPLNYLLFAGTIIFILGHDGQPASFTAYVASGLLVWMFISETITQSNTLFLREESLIRGTVLPVSVYVLRQTTLTAIRSGYALCGAAAIILFSEIQPSAALFSIVPAIGLLLLTAPAVAMLFGFAGVLFRDFQFIVSNGMRLMIFATPVFWVHGGQGGLRGLLYHWNPITHYIDIIRLPIVEGTVPFASWLVAGGTTAALGAGALYVLGRFGRQIVFLL